MKRIWLFIGLVLVVVSCGVPSADSKKREIVSALVAGEQTDEEIQAELKGIEKEELERMKIEKANKTTLSFDRLDHDYGNVKPESDNKTYFIVTNTGDKPLIIEDVSASCGCTTPEKPEKPIAPGKSDKLAVNFHPKPDQKNEIRKTVTVTANTEPKVHTLNIRAFVK